MFFLGERGLITIPRRSSQARITSTGICGCARYDLYDMIVPTEKIFNLIELREPGWHTPWRIAQPYLKIHCCGRSHKGWNNIIQPILGNNFFGRGLDWLEQYYPNPLQKSTFLRVVSKVCTQYGNHSMLHGCEPS